MRGRWCHDDDVIMRGRWCHGVQMCRWRHNAFIICGLQDPPKEDLTVSEKFQLVLDVAQKAQVHARKHTLARTHWQARTHSHTHGHTRTHSRIRQHKGTQTLRHRNTRTHTHRQRHTHTQKDTHACTHTSCTVCFFIFCVSTVMCLNWHQNNMYTRRRWSSLN